MIVPSFAPMAPAASMYSTSRTVRTELLTILAKVGTADRDSEIIRFVVLAPKAATMTMAKSVMGMARKISVILIIISSRSPP